MKISVILIGRNDQHGYNLHKRVASSINSISSILTENDEILFVDWNSPIDMPPLLHSISDTLIPKARKLIKILKVTGEQHQRVAAGSHRKILEPIARNVGIRRSNPEASWILSTNTDMLFKMSETEYLSEILSGKKLSLLTLFRNEIPEYYWDSLDRFNVNSTNIKLEKLKNSYVNRHILVEHKMQKQKILIPDGVGDFQLAPRNFWNQMGGFPEDKLLGWHNDTRLAIQMVKKIKCEIEVLNDDDMIGFHQNHYRSLVEGHDNPNINTSDIVYKEYDNGTSWGLGNEDLEIVSVDKKFSTQIIIPSSYSERESTESGLILPEQLRDIHTSINEDYRRMLFFINDDISLLEENSRVIYVGVNENFFGTLNFNLGKRLHRIDLSKTSTAKLIFEEMTKLSISDHDLVFFDLGIESVGSAKFHRVSPDRTDNELTPQDIYSRELILQILKSIPIFAIYLQKENLTTKVGFLRNQNWPNLYLTKSYFSLALFNNYSGYLSGRVRHVRFQNAFKTAQLMYSARDYYLGNYSELVPGAYFYKVAFKIYRKLPKFFRVRMHKIVSKFYLR